MEETSLTLAYEIEHVLLPEKLLKAANAELSPNPSPGRRIQKVPPRLRQEQSHLYDPNVVSLGPYHHGKEEFQLAEDFKVKALKIVVTDSGKNVKFFYTKVLERVTDARNCYVEDSTNQFDDPTFAQMMLLDSCFIICFMLSCIEGKIDEIIKNHFGDLNYLTHIFCDMFLLENQIPFRIFMLLISSAYSHKRCEELLQTYFRANFFEEYVGQGKVIVQNPKSVPDHLLDALRLFLITQEPPRRGRMKGKGIPLSEIENSRVRRFVVIKGSERQSMPSRPSLTQNLLGKLRKCNISKFPWINRPKSANDEKYIYQKYYFHSFRSVTDLKAKGIQFRPSRGGSLKDIRFKPGYFWAQLEVPSWVVGKDTKVLFSNMIAYEVCGYDHLDRRVVTAYINFIKSLIQNPKDVKELREKEILHIPSGSDEEIVKLFNEINPVGILSPSTFHKVTKEIEAHYNSKAKTWLAEFIYTYFWSPWTAIALFAATFLLVLAFLQTYYTLNPPKK